MDENRIDEAVEMIEMAEQPSGALGKILAIGGALVAGTVVTLVLTKEKRVKRKREKCITWLENHPENEETEEVSSNGSEKE